MKGYSTLPKAPGQKPHHQMICAISRILVRDEGIYPSAEMQLAYSTAEWAQVVEAVNLECQEDLLSVRFPGKPSLINTVKNSQGVK